MIQAAEPECPFQARHRPERQPPRLWSVCTDFLSDRFVAGPGTTGPGIGLYLARGIAEAHRGTLTVESRVGQGAIFRLTLPSRNDGVAHHRGAGPELQARRNSLASEGNAKGG
jgi:hypothetical protein